MQTGLLGSVAYLTSTLKSLLGDSIKIIRDQKRFIFDELTNRALESENGYAMAHLGFSFAKICNFIVITNEMLIKESLTSEITPQKTELEASFNLLNATKNWDENKSIDEIIRLSCEEVVSKENQGEQLSALLTKAIIHISNSRDLQDKLRASLNSVNLENLKKENSVVQELQKCELLHHHYLESIRFFSQILPVVQYYPKASKIGPLDIPAKSYIFIPLSKIMSHEKIWENPGVYNPSRTEYLKNRLDYSASPGLGEVVFKMALIALFKDHELTITLNENECFGTLTQIEPQRALGWVPSYYSRRQPIVIKDKPSPRRSLCEAT